MVWYAILRLAPERELDRNCIAEYIKCGYIPFNFRVQSPVPSLPTSNLTRVVMNLINPLYNDLIYLTLCLYCFWKVIEHFQEFVFNRNFNLFFACSRSDCIVVKLNQHRRIYLQWRANEKSSLHIHLSLTSCEYSVNVIVIITLLS